jgi:hypothetical protein
MESSLILVAIVQSISISLGVGASTLAIINFFMAIADGTIDATERYMMGAVYVVLRLAMVLILATTLLLFIVEYLNDTLALSTYYGQFTLLAVLYLNAVLMTARIMPSTIGPALQASSWYTLGILSAVASVGATSFTYLQFLLAYMSVFLLAVSVVNGIMSYQKAKRATPPNTPGRS